MVSSVGSVASPSEQSLALPVPVHGPTAALLMSSHIPPTLVAPISDASAKSTFTTINPKPKRKDNEGQTVAKPLKAPKTPSPLPPKGPAAKRTPRRREAKTKVAKKEVKMTVSKLKPEAEGGRESNTRPYHQSRPPVSLPHSGSGRHVSLSFPAALDHASRPVGMPFSGLDMPKPPILQVTKASPPTKVAASLPFNSNLLWPTWPKGPPTFRSLPWDQVTALTSTSAPSSASNALNSNTTVSPADSVHATAGTKRGDDLAAGHEGTVNEDNINMVNLLLIKGAETMIICVSTRQRSRFTRRVEAADKVLVGTVRVTNNTMPCSEFVGSDTDTDTDGADGDDDSMADLVLNKGEETVMILRISKRQWSRFMGHAEVHMRSNTDTRDEIDVAEALLLMSGSDAPEVYLGSMSNDAWTRDGTDKLA